MVAIKQQPILLRRLKKHVRKLQQREKSSREQLQLAINKMRQLDRTYKPKIAVTGSKKNLKVLAHSTSPYARVVASLEARMLKCIEGKSKALTVAIARLEKLYQAQAKSPASKRSKLRANGHHHRNMGNDS